MDYSSRMDEDGGMSPCLFASVGSTSAMMHVPPNSPQTSAVSAVTTNELRLMLDPSVSGHAAEHTYLTALAAPRSSAFCFVGMNLD